MIKQKVRLNEENNYILMLKDIEVCSINRCTGEVIVYNANLMPFDIHLEEGIDAANVNNITVFNWWCANRVLSLAREHAKVILNSCGLKHAFTDKDKADIALEYRCLSLKDFYWVKQRNSIENWKDMNLFDNHFSNAVVNIALKGENLPITDKRLINADLTTAGVFPKAWYREGKTFYLYKGNINNSVEKEVRASEILRQLGFPVLLYKKTIHENEIVSCSECFTGKEKGYITAGDMNQNYDISVYCNYNYDIMTLCDYLVGNSDRRENTWGFLFDDRREIIGLAPIFNFNHAFEGTVDNLCLPELLFDREIRMLEKACKVIKKYNIQLESLEEIDKYTKFVNERIKLLYK